MIAKDNQIDHIQKKLVRLKLMQYSSPNKIFLIETYFILKVYVQDTLAVEEDAKRRMLLRYIHAVKE